ncbi:sigma-70 family RNA polymerase sigma factor [Porticoccus sp. W117]|uniref:sigma-70 family RNA polymerase sigma factor n=1 Tax=Porticoccus sp. W117 TaxID=3054777 RepID=UPI0025986A32|nr:sigma-70 family RNA polymerase sigma factor [Porticoccus sp. W117]MDM3870970.1 sigma-70 family RNA polymerase sigma factor [Porticoccus sp. W117]
MKHTHKKVVDISSARRCERNELVQRLFDKHGAGVRTFLRGRLVPDADVEDIVQDMFARLLTLDNLEQKMDASSGSNIALLLTMANNMVVDRARKLSVRQNYQQAAQLEQEEHSGGAGLEKIIADQRELEQVRRVILAMKPSWQKAFLLSRFRNLGYREIARQMNVTVKQVEHYIAQAMNSLRSAKRRNYPKGKQS